jgi:hypothetical protein
MKKRAATLLGIAMLLGGCHREATYAEGCGTMPANWINPRHGRGVMSFLNVISVASDGSILFNENRISEPTLASYLRQVSTMNPLPVTQIKFEPSVDCGKVIRLRKLMSKSLDCSYGKCAEGSGRWWKIGDVGPPFLTYDPHPELPQDR